MGYNPIPASSQQLCRYAAFLARRLSSTSIPKYLNVVRLMSLECGLPNPLQDDWQLRSLLLGIKRVKGSSVTRKVPITPPLLLKIYGLINLSLPEDLAFWASSLVMFFGLLRKSNVLAPSLSGFDESKHLRRCDFLPRPWGVEVTIRWSKTIQYRERSLSVPLPILPNHPLCPTIAILRYFKITAGAPPDGPAFTVPSGDAFRPLTYPKFVKILRSLLVKLGCSPSQYAGHSFRRGGASWALEAGLSGDVIQILGDWKSDAYKQYLVIPLESKVACIKQFSANLPLS